MILNEIGVVANKYLQEIPGHFSHVHLDEFMVMPNHIDCILSLDNVGTSPVGTSYIMSLQRNEFSKPVKGSVSVTIQQFKASVKRS